MPLAIAGSLCRCCLVTLALSSLSPGYAFVLLFRRFFLRFFFAADAAMPPPLRLSPLLTLSFAFLSFHFLHTLFHIFVAAFR